MITFQYRIGVQRSSVHSGGRDKVYVWVRGARGISYRQISHKLLFTDRPSSVFPIDCL